MKKHLIILLFISTLFACKTKKSYYEEYKEKFQNLSEEFVVNVAKSYYFSTYTLDSSIAINKRLNIDVKVDSLNYRGKDDMMLYLTVTNKNDENIVYCSFSIYMADSTVNFPFYHSTVISCKEVLKAHTATPVYLNTSIYKGNKFFSFCTDYILEKSGEKYLVPLDSIKNKM